MRDRGSVNSGASKGFTIAAELQRMVMESSCCRRIEKTGMMEIHDLLSYSFCHAILYLVWALRPTISPPPPPPPLDSPIVSARGVPRAFDIQKKKILPLPGLVADIRNPIKKTTHPSGAIAGVRHLIYKTTPPPPVRTISSIVIACTHFKRKIPSATKFVTDSLMAKLVVAIFYPVSSISTIKTCFKLPRTIRHNSHTTSSLKLRARSLNVTGLFVCNASGESGNSFHHHSIDKFGLHIGCAALPGSLTPELYLKNIFDKVTLINHINLSTMV
ncbi:hypothetical protein LguiB_016494 [Lonicera macranthoides]